MRCLHRPRTGEAGWKALIGKTPVLYPLPKILVPVNLPFEDLWAPKLLPNSGERMVLGGLRQISELSPFTLAH